MKEPDVKPVTNELLDLMIELCNKNWPYVCLGDKTVSESGRDLKCSCGARIKV